MTHIDFGELKGAVRAARQGVRDNARTRRLLQVMLAAGLSALTVVAVAGVLLTELL